MICVKPEDIYDLCSEMKTYIAKELKTLPKLKQLNFFMMGEPLVNKNISKNFGILADIDFRLLPGLIGNYSLEHKLLFTWNKSDRFRVLTGYKLVMGDFPYGSDIRLLPYIPMVETWVPIIELQWAGTNKEN